MICLGHTAGSYMQVFYFLQPSLVTLPGIFQGSLVTLPGIMQGSCAGSCRFDEKALLCRLHADVGSWRLDGGRGMSAAFLIPTAESCCSPHCSKPGCCAAPACTEAVPAASDAASRDKSTAAAPASAHSEAVSHASGAVAEDEATPAAGAVSTPHAAAGKAANAAMTYSMPLLLPFPAFTAPLSPATLRQHLGCSDAAAEASVAAGDSSNKQILAGLPKLHASTLEVLCVSGLLTAAQTDEDWTSVELHVFVRSAQWLTAFAQAWLIESVSQPQPTVYQFPALELHIQLLCESPLLT